MREFALAYVPSSWLGRKGSRFGTRLRVTISLGEGGAGAELDRGRDPKVGSSKSEFLSGMNEQGETSASSKCKFTR